MGSKGYTNKKKKRDPRRVAAGKKARAKQVRGVRKAGKARKKKR